jgi:hypothetical protein
MLRLCKKCLCSPILRETAFTESAGFATRRVHHASFVGGASSMYDACRALLHADMVTEYRRIDAEPAGTSDKDIKTRWQCTKPY